MTIHKLLFALVLATAAPMLPCIDAPVAQAQNIILQKHMRQGRALMDKGNYEAALKQFDLALKEAPSNSEARRLRDICRERLQESREARRAEAERRERQDYETACDKASVEALQDFIARYPKSGFRTDAERKIEDIDAWNTACRANTKEAYQRYINTSAVGAFASNARTRIANIETEEANRRAEQAWRAAKDSNNPQDLLTFAQNYSSSAHANDARHLAYSRMGETAYSEGNYAKAKDYYIRARAISSLSNDAQRHYQNIIDREEAEKRDRIAREAYDRAMASTDVEAVLRYLNSADSRSAYYAHVSDHYAYLLATKFSWYTTTESEIANAMRYAKTEATKNYIDERRKQLEAYRKKQDRILHRQNRRNWCSTHLQLGVNFATALGYADGSEYSGRKWDVYNLYPRATMRIGCPSENLVNLVTGIGYNCLRELSDLSDDSDYSDYGSYGNYGTLSHNFDIPIVLRFNWCGLWIEEDSKARHYIGVGANYTRRFMEGPYMSPYDFETSQNWGAIIEWGYNGKHFDGNIFMNYVPKGWGLGGSGFLFGLSFGYFF